MLNEIYLNKFRDYQHSAPYFEKSVFCFWVARGELKTLKMDGRVRQRVKAIFMTAGKIACLNWKIHEGGEKLELIENLKRNQIQNSYC